MRADPDDGYPPRPQGCLPPLLVLVVLAAIAVGALVCAIETAYGEESGQAWCSRAGCDPASPSAGPARPFETARVQGRPVSPIFIAESPTPVQPKRECGGREAMLAFALRMFKERPVAALPAQSGATLVVLLSDAKSWTVLECNPVACCVVATGQNATFLPGA